MVEGVPAPVVSKPQADKGDIFHTRFFHFGRNHRARKNDLVAQWCSMDRFLGLIACASPWIELRPCHPTAMKWQPSKQDLRQRFHQCKLDHNSSNTVVIGYQPLWTIFRLLKVLGNLTACLIQLWWLQQKQSSHIVHFPRELATN